MASNTCSELIIDPDFEPYHLNANHSNISFGMALRNLANKQSFILKQSVSDDSLSLSGDQILNVQPISVALPSVSLEATLNPQPVHEHSTDPDFVITSDSDVEDEHVVQINASSDSSAPFVLEPVHDIPSSSTTNTSQLTNVSPSPTFLLDSVILKEVCDNIFKDLNNLVKTSSNFVHKEDYVSEWSRSLLQMCELRLCDV